ncbi:adenylate/guanylate cyclase domain-containing protein [Trichothermofontia sp.]
MLKPIATRLRPLLPADLYIAAWMESSSEVVMQVFEHLQSLQWMLHDYVPPQVAQSPPQPGQLRWHWQEGTLLFTDLAGFTPLMEANARCGQAGTEVMLTQLNAYFAAMIEILSKSGGNLLEFTGDAMLAQFPADPQHRDIKRAIRAGLRMQRAMVQFTELPIAGEVYTLQMRVGIHRGRFLQADIGLPYVWNMSSWDNRCKSPKPARATAKWGVFACRKPRPNRWKPSFGLMPGARATASCAMISARSNWVNTI